MKLRQLCESQDTIEIVNIETGYSPSGMSLSHTLHSISYDQLVEKFGEPEKSEGEDKVQVFWEVQVDYRDTSDMDKYKYDDPDDPWKEGDDLEYDTVYFQIYDWKEDKPFQQVTQWNVAARRDDKWYVREVLDAIFPRNH